jgi:hypothetical protein
MNSIALHPFGLIYGNKEIYYITVSELSPAFAA